MKTHTMTMTTEALSKSALARRLKTSRTTIQKYLDREDAPRPVRPGLYDFEAVAKFIGATSTHILAGDEFRELRTRLLRASCESAELELKIRKGEFVRLASVWPQIARMIPALQAELYAKFESEFPSRYAGKGIVEISLMNRDALDQAFDAFRTGGAAIAPPAAQ